MKSFIVGAAVALVLFLDGGSAHAQNTSGSVTWGAWSFSWSLDSSAGLAVRSVRRNNVLYINKMSMPAVRVKYYPNNPCGPFIDRISTDVITLSNGKFERIAYGANNAYVKIWIEATLSAYRLRQGYIFYADGRLVPYLESSGLQCTTGFTTHHIHHPYWRIDADIGNANSDQITSEDNTTITSWTVEQQQVKGPGRNWYVRDLGYGKTLSISPSPDGVADTYGTWDFAALLYKFPHEGEPWPDTNGDVVVTSDNNENIWQKDVIVWYAGHLVHNTPANADPNQWGYVGPVLQCY
jgi:hypothetical protein